MRTKKKSGYVKDILWSYDLKRFDVEKFAKIVVVQAINYGEWKHWVRIADMYGSVRIRRIIENTPISEFRPAALALAAVIFGVKKMKYASRSSYIKSKKTVAKA